MQRPNHAAKLGWRLLMLSVILAIPVIAWWPVELSQCTKETQYYVRERVGLIFFWMVTSIVPILVVGWVYISSIVSAVQAYRSCGRRVRQMIALSMMVVLIYYALRIYFETVCASLFGLVGLMLTVLTLSFISVRLIATKEDDVL